jgi:hypothetical protein
VSPFFQGSLIPEVGVFLGEGTRVDVSWDFPSVPFICDVHASGILPVDALLAALAFDAPGLSFVPPVGVGDALLFLSLDPAPMVGFLVMWDDSRVIPLSSIPTGLIDCVPVASTTSRGHPPFSLGFSPGVVMWAGLP